MQSDIVVHSIREAEVALSLLDAYDVEKSRFTEVVVASLKKLGQDILARKYSTKHSEYVYEAPQEITERESTIDGHWKTLDELSADRRKTLDDLKAREERKEALRIEFADAAGDLVRLCDDAVSVIGTEAEQSIMFGFSLKEVEAYRATLDEQDLSVSKGLDEKKAEVASIVNEMTSLVKQTADFDTAQVEGRKEAEAEAAAAAEELSPPPVEEDVAGSPNRMRKTRFNTLTKSFKKAFTKKKKTRSMLPAGAIFEGEAGAPWPEEKNPYSEVSVDNLMAKEKSLLEAQGARQQFYAKELQRWQENDAACKAYADAVCPVQADVKELTTKLMANKGTDEAQLEEVNAALDTLHQKAFKIPEYETLAQTVSTRGITSNPYTSLTVEDIKCELENIQLIAEQKKPYLESLIAFEKYKVRANLMFCQWQLCDTFFSAGNFSRAVRSHGNPL